MLSRLPSPSHVLATVILIVFSLARSAAQECRVTTNVRPLNQHEQPVLDIKADQLKVEIGGRAAKVLAFSPASKPGVILLIDASSSMKGTWSESIAAAKKLAASAESIAAVVFREKLEAYANGRTDTDKLLDQLSTRTFSRGGTALYDTLIEMAGRVRNRNTVLVVISDGEDNSSHHSSDDTISLFLRSSWPPVFGLILDYDHEDKRHGNIQRIASATGGLLAIPSSASKVSDAQNQLAAEVNAPFTITLEPMQPISKATKLKLEILGADNKPRHDVHFASVAEVEGCDPLPSSP